VLATVGSFAVAATVRLCFLGRYVTWRVPKGSVRATFGELPALLRFGAVLVPSILVGSFTNQLGTWVVGSVASVSATGAYARALGLANRFNEASYRIGEILMPGMVERARHGDEAGAVALLDRALRIAAIPLLALAAGGGGAAPGVMRVFGPGFAEGADVLALLSLAYVLIVLNYVQNQGFLAAGRPGIVTSQSVLGGALTVGAMVALQRPLGMAGVGLAYVIARVVLVVVADRRLGTLLLGGGRLLGLARLAGLAAAWGAGFAVARALVSVSTGIVMTGAAVAAGVAATCVVAVAVGTVPAGELDRLRTARRRR
jgi:O-antigen/teichoic acid export membrane protein